MSELGREPMGERLARVEEKCVTLSDQLKRQNEYIHDLSDQVEKVRSEVTKELQVIKDQLKAIDTKTTARLTGKEKASIYISLIASSSLIIVELIKSVFV